MRILSSLLCAGLIAVFTTPAAAMGSGTSSAPLTEAQRSEVEDIIREFLTEKHPEVVLEAVKSIKKKEAASQETHTQEALEKAKISLYHDPNSPVRGNPEGDVTIVEFFDYQCSHCKHVEVTVDKLLEEDNNIRFVAKEYPILGPMSQLAAAYALASVKQGKYEAYHKGLMSLGVRISEENLQKVAKNVGLDVAKLKADAHGDDVAKMVQENLLLGKQINVRGTPMFIIGDRVVPGAVDLETMKTMVERAREDKKADAGSDKGEK